MPQNCFETFNIKENLLLREAECAFERVLLTNYTRNCHFRYSPVQTAVIQNSSLRYLVANRAIFSVVFFFLVWGLTHAKYPI